MVVDHSAPDMAPVIPPNGTMSSVSEMPVSPTSVASSGHFAFSASEISGMGADASALDTAKYIPRNPSKITLNQEIYKRFPFLN